MPKKQTADSNENVSPTVAPFTRLTLNSLHTVPVNLPYVSLSTVHTFFWPLCLLPHSHCLHLWTSCLSLILFFRFSPSTCQPPDIVSFFHHPSLPPPTTTFHAPLETALITSPFHQSLPYPPLPSPGSCSPIVRAEVPRRLCHYIDFLLSALYMCTSPGPVPPSPQNPLLSHLGDDLDPSLHNGLVLCHLLCTASGRARSLPTVKLVWYCGLKFKSSQNTGEGSWPLPKSWFKSDRCWNPKIFLGKIFLLLLFFRPHTFMNWIFSTITATQWWAKNEINLENYVVAFVWGH